MANCENCSGCSSAHPCPAQGSLTMTAQELKFLCRLGEVAFLPVARRMGDLEPIYLEEGTEKQSFYCLLLQCLEKKNLISLDYDKPLSGFDMSDYRAYPVHGSIALTQRGQQVLELLDYQGVWEE